MCVTLAVTGRWQFGSDAVVPNRRPHRQCAAAAGADNGSAVAGHCLDANEASGDEFPSTAYSNFSSITPASGPRQNNADLAHVRHIDDIAVIRHTTHDGCARLVLGGTDRNQFVRPAPPDDGYASFARSRARFRPTNHWPSGETSYTLRPEPAAGESRSDLLSNRPSARSSIAFGLPFHDSAFEGSFDDSRRFAEDDMARKWRHV